MIKLCTPIVLLAAACGSTGSIGSSISSGTQVTPAGECCEPGCCDDFPACCESEASAAEDQASTPQSTGEGCCPPVSDCCATITR
jgi:hypothetical protein